MHDCRWIAAGQQHLLTGAAFTYRRCFVSATQGFVLVAWHVGVMGTAVKMHEVECIEGVCQLDSAKSC